MFTKKYLTVLLLCLVSGAPLRAQNEEIQTEIRLHTLHKAWKEVLDRPPSLTDWQVMRYPWAGLTLGLFVGGSLNELDLWLS